MSPAISKPAATLDGSGVDHGFPFDKQGRFTLFDVPGMAPAQARAPSPWTTATQKQSPDRLLTGAMWYTASSWKAVLLNPIFVSQLL